MSAKKLCIVNQKGGVGKTTTAVNLSSYLAEMGHKTLLIDLDPQANATSGTGVDPSKTTVTIYDILMNDQSLIDGIYPSAIENLHVIPATKHLSGAEVELVDVVSRETQLKRHLAPLNNHYEYIIMDCPPSLGLITVNALAYADQVIIPLQCEYFALEGIGRLIETVTQIKDHYNPALHIGGIVLTMYDQRTTLNRQVVDNAKRFFNTLMFETIIPRNIRLSESPSHGIPISLYSNTSKGAEAYKSLTQEVINRV